MKSTRRVMLASYFKCLPLAYAVFMFLMLLQGALPMSATPYLNGLDKSVVVPVFWFVVFALDVALYARASRNRGPQAVRTGSRWLALALILTYLFFPTSATATGKSPTFWLPASLVNSWSSEATMSLAIVPLILLPYMAMSYGARAAEEASTQNQAQTPSLS